MSTRNKPERYCEPGHPYFVTTGTLNRQPCFRDPALAQIVISNLRFYEQRGDFELHGYVVMPDHVHLVLTPIAGSISDVLRNVKSHAALEVRIHLGRSGSIWQPSFHDRIVRCDEHMAKVLHYTHYNPVKAGLVAEPEEYPFSSARQYFSDRSGLGPRATWIEDADERPGLGP